MPCEGSHHDQYRCDPGECDQIAGETPNNKLSRAPVRTREAAIPGARRWPVLAISVSSCTETFICDVYR
jgi:hypothetical protein